MCDHRTKTKTPIRFEMVFVFDMKKIRFVVVVFFSIIIIVQVATSSTLNVISKCDRKEQIKGNILFLSLSNLMGITESLLYREGAHYLIFKERGAQPLEKKQFERN